MTNERCNPDLGQLTAKLLEQQREIARLTAERDEAWLKIGHIRNEIDCRIEHGADSNGHLEAIRTLMDKEDGK